MLVVDAGKDFEKNNPQPVGKLERMGRAKGKSSNKTYFLGIMTNVVGCLGVKNLLFTAL